jgi:hypothetical protein
VAVDVDVDGLRLGDVDRLRRRACTACGGEPAAPEVVHRLRRGDVDRLRRRSCTACGGGRLRRGPCTACGGFRAPPGAGASRLS